mgnify:CR=1 FL=1
MFPLGTVLFPTMVLPLHVFEPRYRALVQDALATDQEFGVCLIERGHEVGGGDVRSDVGTIAQIVDAQELPDGRWAVAAVGTRRFRVRAWLDDDPYPRAEIDDWLDPPAADADAATARRDAVVDQLRMVLALQTESGMPAAPATTEIDADPALASYQVAALAPFGPFDGQRLLSAESVDARLGLLADLLDEAEQDLRRNLELG